MHTHLYAEKSAVESDDSTAYGAVTADADNTILY